VKDVQGSLAQNMGVNQRTQETRDAVFTVNGGNERTSKSNNVEVARGVEATIRSEGSTEISFRNDAGAAVSAVKELVGAINRAIESVKPEDGRGSARFVNDLAGMTRSFSATLDRVGIQVDRKTGTLSVDNAKLQKAAEDGSLQRVFDGQNYGFHGRLDRISNNAAQSNHYRDPFTIQSSFSNSFKNPFDFDSPWGDMGSLLNPNTYNDLYHPY
jgi:flagellar capping protein FliD